MLQPLPVVRLIEGQTTGTAGEDTGAPSAIIFQHGNREIGDSLRCPLLLPLSPLPTAVPCHGHSPSNHGSIRLTSKRICAILSLVSPANAAPPLCPEIAKCEKWRVIPGHKGFRLEEWFLPETLLRPSSRRIILRTREKTATLNGAVIAKVQKSAIHFRFLHGSAVMRRIYGLQQSSPRRCCFSCRPSPRWSSRRSCLPRQPSR